MELLPETLPDEYELTNRYTITGEEVVELRDSGDWGTERDANLWQRVVENSMCVAGVRQS